MAAGDTITFVINDDDTSGGAVPHVQVTVTENADGTLTFQLTQPTSAGAYLGDLRAFFFDVSDESLIGSLTTSSPTPTLLTGFQQGNDSIVDLGGDALIIPLVGADGGFDAGIEIGTSGIGGNDVRSFTFTLDSSLRNLTLDDVSDVDYGVRLTSVGQDTNGDGTIDTARTASAKVIEIPGGPNWEAFKDVDAGTSNGLCDDESIPVESKGATENTVGVDVDHAHQVLTYTVSIVNDGDVAVDGTDIVVTDSYEGGADVDVNSIPGVIFSGDDVNPGVFDPGETWTWTYTHEVTQAEIDSDGGGDGLLSNSATASTISGILPDATMTTDVEVCYHPDWQAFKDVDAGTSGGFCEDESIPVESQGATENTVAVDVDHAHQVLTYTVSIVNDGDVSVDASDIVVTDSFEGGADVDVNTIPGVIFAGDDVNPGVFDPGETWSWTYTHEVTQAEVDSDGNGDGLLSNSATASTISGILPESTMTTDVEVCQAPAVTIEKNILCHDEVLAADQSVNLLKDGDGKVTYQIVVANTGNVTILDPVVTDSVNGSLPQPVESIDQDGILQVGETWTYTYDADWVAGGPYTNTATVQSESWSLNEPDDAIYFGLNPVITIDKKTNGEDHGVEIAAGQTVTWTYDVTNDGNVDLTGIDVTDDNGTSGTGDDFHPTYVDGDDGDGILNPGETWHYSASGIAEAGAYENTATVTADDVSDDCGDSVPVSDQDTSDYTGTFEPGFEGLTAGFWSQHLRAWDLLDNPTAKGGYNLNNLVSSGVLAKTDVLAGEGNPGKLLIGDANGNNTADGGEFTLTIDSLALAVSLVSASLSTKSDARLNLLQQAVASQLNVDNHPGTVGNGGPGGFGADDLLGTAAKWLLGGLTFEAGGTNAAFSVDKNGNGKLDSFDFSNVSKLVFTGTAVSTSSADWNAKFLIDSSNSLFGGDQVFATGAELKNALEAYNQGHLVISADGTQIGWDNGGISDVQANTQDGLWKVLIDHGIGSHHA